MPTALSLPSQQSARELVSGVPGAWLPVAIHTLGRAWFIGLGLGLARVPSKYIVKGAIAGSVIVELFVLGHQYYQIRTATPPT
jgi:hypothetical protein